MSFAKFDQTLKEYSARELTTKNEATLDMEELELFVSEVINQMFILPFLDDTEIRICSLRKYEYSLNEQLDLVLNPDLQDINDLQILYKQVFDFSNLSVSDGTEYTETEALEILQRHIYEAVEHKLKSFRNSQHLKILRFLKHKLSFEYLLGLIHTRISRQIFSYENSVEVREYCVGDVLSFDNLDLQHQSVAGVLEMLKVSLRTFNNLPMTNRIVLIKLSNIDYLVVNQHQNGVFCFETVRNSDELEILGKLVANERKEILKEDIYREQSLRIFLEVLRNNRINFDMDSEVKFVDSLIAYLGPKVSVR